MKKFKNIKVIIWDIDGTLYKSIPESKEIIVEDTLKRIEKKLGVNRNKAIELLEVNYQKFSSTTKVLLELGFSWQEIVKRLERCLYFKTKFIKKDPDLILMFKKLSNFRHLIASNNPEEVCRELLRPLGLKAEIFEKIFGNTVDAIKPDLKFFQRILDYTGLSAGQHLFVGDRDKTEIIPAQKLGMKTCFVWGKSKIADASISKIYDIVKIV